MRLRGYVFAGGRSRRFGSDKARAELRGRPLILHATEVVAAFCGDVTVVAAPGRSFDDLGLRTIFDEVADRGPLGGLQAALADAEHGHAAVTACDFVGADPAWFELLAQKLTGHAEHGAVAFRDEQRWHPLFAIYSTQLLGEVRRRLDADLLSMQGLLDEVALAVEVPADFHRARSIDTPGALLDYRDHE